MRVLARKTLRDFYEQHSDSRAALESWFQEAVQSRWKAPGDLKLRYPSADILPGNRVVFNIKGNSYRLIVKIHYNMSIVYIRFVGTHAAYDKNRRHHYLALMKIKIIKTADEYSAALVKVESLMDALAESEQEEELELWSLLVERYEQEHFVIDHPDPVEAIKFRMEQEGLRQKDLARFFPGKNRVSEVLHHKRPLTLGMIRSLHQGLGIPAEVLLREVHV